MELPTELPELIDTHCHLNYDYAPKSADDLVREAQDTGITTLITIGTNLEALPSMVAISERHARVFHTVGVHPHDAVTLGPNDLEKLAIAAKHPKCVAIGEIGLDYHYDHSPRDIQRQQFEIQLELALQMDLPVVIHAREAEADLLEALKRYASRLKPASIPGIIHCFSGTQVFGQACVELGFYISFSGIITFKTGEDLRKAAQTYPLDRLLVETDSPYLAPIPYRGKKCEPTMVRLTAQKLAEVRGLPLSEIATITTTNARRVFKLDQS
ncbi:TatD family hydrolase [Bdellovibrionota bacterium FG-1]